MTDSTLLFNDQSRTAVFTVVLLVLGGFMSSPTLAQNASFTIRPTSTPYPGQTITLDGTPSTFTLGYVWYIDGTQVRSSPGADDGLTFDTTFASTGTKTIRLEVSSRNDDCDPIQDPDCDLVNSSSTSKTITVENAAPTAENATLGTNEDQSGTVDLSGKINDPNDSVSSLNISIVSGPAHGNTSVSGRSVTYAPNSNFNGSDHFDYRVSDGAKSSNTRTVSITVNSVNDAPTAQDATLTTDEDQSASVDLSPNIDDVDDPASSLNISVVNGPFHGASSVSGRSVTYTPNTNYNGSDSFDYRVSDGSKTSTTKTVSITVNPVDDTPTANADNYSVREDGELSVSAPGVLANDTDTDDSLTASNVSTPSTGTLTSFQNDGSFTFDPNGEFAFLPSGSSKTVSFAYAATGGRASDSATVSIQVQGVNSPPVAAADSGYTTTEDQTLRVTNSGNGLLTNDRDPEGDALQVVAQPVMAPKGTVSLNADGTFQYEPPSDMNGSDSFTYRVSDGNNTATATVHITIKKQPDITLAGGTSYNPPSPTPNTHQNPIGRFELSADERTPSGTRPVWNAVTITNSSSRQANGIEAVELWLSDDDTFAPSRDSLLLTKFLGPSNSISGSVTLTGAHHPIPTTEIEYVFLVANLTSSAKGQFDPVIRDETQIQFIDGVLSTVNGSSEESFTNLALSSASTPLPVELASFEATRADQAVRLSWATASETGNAQFRIQRRAGAPTEPIRPSSNGARFHKHSKDGPSEAWKTIEVVDGAGTTSEAQQYRFTDEELPYSADTLAYRLKQVDTDGGSFVTTPVVVGRTAESVELRSVAPNPARSRVAVRFAVPQKEHTTLRLFDVLGREVRTVMSGPVQGRQKRAVDVSTLPSGLYLLHLRAGQTRKTERLTVVQ